jgi:hypothetical protein
MLTGKVVPQFGVILRLTAWFNYKFISCIKNFSQSSK